MAAPLDFAADQPLSTSFRSAITTTLGTFVDRRSADLVEIHAGLARLGHLARTFTSGGKRVRPGFCFWSYVAAAGAPGDLEAVLKASASLDLLHVSALMHDDVMDSSDTRRGLPAAHRQLEAEHQAAAGRGDSAAFGRAGAILLGDLLLVWSQELFTSCGLPTAALSRAEPHLAEVRHEVTAGQYLDVLAQARLGADAHDLAADISLAERVVEFKTARYTVARPCQIGAALGGGSPELIEALGRFGSLIGRAFQYRDDLLGVFGDERVTGKPAGDDLREGKRTVVVAHALAQSSPAAAAELDACLGDQQLSGDQLERARQLIADSGAADTTERAIREGHQRALEALEPVEMTAQGRTALVALAQACVNRTA